MSLFLVLVMGMSLILFLPKIDFLPPWSPGGFFYSQVSLVLFNFLLYISCIVLIYFLEVFFMAKKGWQFFLGEDVVAELDEYAKEWGMTRSAALTMIIKTVVGGKKVINAPEDSSDSVFSDLLSHA